MGEALHTLVADGVAYFGPQFSITLFLLVAGATFLLMATPFSSKGTKE
jgi:hypothetical protein